MKPPDVDVGLPKSGVNAAASDVAVDVFEPLTYPVLVVVIVAIELVPAATPVTVIKPLPLIATEPDVTELPHVYKVLLLSTV